MDMDMVGYKLFEEYLWIIILLIKGILFEIRKKNRYGR